MKPFLSWLFGPSRVLAQANAEITYLRGEVARLNSLLTQAWEVSRVVPVAADRATPPPPESEPIKSWAQMQAEYATECIANREKWERDETARLEQARRINSERLN